MKNVYSLYPQNKYLFQRLSFVVKFSKHENFRLYSIYPLILNYDFVCNDLSSACCLLLNLISQWYIKLYTAYITVTYKYQPVAIVGCLTDQCSSYDTLSTRMAILTHCKIHPVYQLKSIIFKRRFCLLHLYKKAEYAESCL